MRIRHKKKNNQQHFKIFAAKHYNRKEPKSAKKKKSINYTVINRTSLNHFKGNQDTIILLIQNIDRNNRNRFLLDTMIYHFGSGVTSTTTAIITSKLQSFQVYWARRAVRLKIHNHNPLNYGQYIR
jgi:hypothetical protein